MAFSFFFASLGLQLCISPKLVQSIKGRHLESILAGDISSPTSFPSFLSFLIPFFLSPPLNMKQEAWSPKWWPFWDQEQSLRTSWHWEWKNEKTERNENLWFDLFELLALWYNCPYYWSQMQTSVIVICKRKHIANPLTITIYFSMLK